MFHSSDLSFYIIALGCSKNLVDGEKLKGRLLSASFNCASSSEEADILIILTCGFITPAKEESLNTIFDAISCRGNVKSPSGFKPVLAVIGCLSARYFTEIKSEIPEIDFLYGIPDGGFVQKLARALNIALDSRELQRQTPLSGSPAYRYIKIADGCSNDCSYCAIPFIRGPMAAYPPEQILADVCNAAEDGVKELIFVAQDTAAYRHGRTSAADLLKAAASVEGIDWIRLLYCHPDHISAELINCIAETEKAVPYMDIPFQHVSERLLVSMGRKGNYDKYLELVTGLREKIPGIAIRSTFMTGYPGEKADDFKLLLRFLQEARLDRVGAFVYSSEEGTRAAALGGAVSRRTAQSRYGRLMEVQQEISAEKLHERIGTYMDVIVEDRIDAATYACRSEFDAPEVDGIFYLTANDLPINSIVRAYVTDSTEYDLIGEHFEIS